MNVRLVRFLAAIALLLATTTTVAFAGDVPLTATWETLGGSGVFDDGKATYANGDLVSGNPTPVSCYLGVGAKNVVLVTYHSGRKLTFKFDNSESGVWGSGPNGAGLEQSFAAEVDFYGQLKSGYLNMAVGDTKPIAADLEFHYGTAPETYGLRYSSLMVTRTDTSTWRITSDPGVSGRATATLSIIRRRGGQSFGTVTMPIQFTVTKQ